MDNILDILCDYSIRNREVDAKFLKHVFMILKKGNEEYVRKLKMRKINNLSNNGVHNPMSYSYFSKSIYAHPNEIAEVRNLLFSTTNYKNWSDLNQIFLVNAMTLFGLLHEFEHVYQFDKLFNCNDSIEGKLLGLTHFPYLQMDKEDSFSKFLMRHMGIFLNDNIRETFFQIGKFNRSFGTKVLYERLANIYASEKMNKLLEKVDIDIDKVKNYFAVDLVFYLLHGFDEEKSVFYPMVRYIREIRSLNIPEINSYIDNVVIPAISEVTNGYERFMYGLYVTDEEIKDLKKILS